MSDALTTEDTTHINLTVEAIKYIFVNTVEDRNKLLQTIKISLLTMLKMH